MSRLKFILSGGGTGGHIYPAIAIADELKRRHPDAEFLFVGARDRMEMQKVPEAGYSIIGLGISGFQRKLSLKNLKIPFQLMSSLQKSKKIIKQNRPDAVIGTGGYASAPLLKAATSKKIPTLIQEQNAFAGMTNKWLAGKVNKICVAYENMEKYFPREKIVVTGNPVRSALIETSAKRAAGIETFGLQPEKKTLLVIGGSLGAKVINETIAKHIDFFEELDLQVIWQCGSVYYEQYQGFNQKETVQVHAFLNEMDKAYAVADFIISRAGAIAVSELSIVGKPTLFIPSPNVAEDHQTKNALALVEKEAAIMLKEEELETSFQTELSALLTDKDKQELLAHNIKKMAKPRATHAIVNEIEKLIFKNER